MIVADLARNIFMELGEPTDISIPSISFWLISNIGQLNNLIDEEFTIESSQIVPEISDNQGVIFAKLYEIYYIKRQVKANLGAAAYSSVTEVREGNRTVRVTSKNEIAKTYQLTLRDVQDELDQLLLSYKMNQARPRQVAVLNPIIYEDCNAGFGSCGCNRCRSCN
jgi:hypothetical protein